MSDFYTIKLHKDDEMRDFSFEKSFKSKYIYKQLITEIKQIYGGNLIPAWRNDDDVLIYITNDDDIDEAIRFHRHSEVNRHNSMNSKYLEMSVSVVPGEPEIEEDEDRNDAYKTQKPLQEGIVKISTAVNPHHIETDRELYELQQQFIQEQRDRVVNNVPNQRVPNNPRNRFNHLPRPRMQPDEHFHYRVENGMFVPIRPDERDQPMDVDEDVEDHLNRIIQQERQENNGGNQMPANNQVQNNREFQMFANIRGGNPLGMPFGNGFMNEYPALDPQIVEQHHRPVPEQPVFRRPWEAMHAGNMDNRLNEWRAPRPRQMYTEQQRQELQREFNQRRFPDENEREQIGNRIGLTEVLVRNWFKNERAKQRGRERALGRLDLN